MNVSRRKKAEELFQVAVDLTVDRRAEFLNDQCGSDAELRTDVEQLLHAHDSDMGDFLRTLTVHQRPTTPPGVSPTLIPSDRVAARIGHYHVQREIGRGGMGMVYLAVDSKLDRNVALKLLPDEFSHDPQRLALFEREARTAANLNHPNIATIYELGEFDGSYFIAMEYVEGRLLSDLMQESQPVSLPEFLDIAVQIAQGLTAAHDSNVVHRDLKPGNLMITNEARVKILDFGLAKALQSDAATATGPRAPVRSTTSSTFLGTVGYSSPEQCSGKPVDLRCDLFSFGVVLYELATGVAPFTRPSLPDTISAVLNDDPEPPTVVNSDLPAELADLIGKLLAKQPDDRYQSSAEVLAELQEMKRRLEAPRHRRLKNATIALGAAVILLAIVMPFVWFAGPGPKDPKIVQIMELLDSEEIGKARVLLKEMEDDWGEEDERLIEPRQQLKQVTLGLVDRHFLFLVVLLSAGEFMQAIDIVTKICLLDEKESCPRAHGLQEEAQALKTRTGRLDQAASGHLDAGELDQAWKTIKQLKGVRFQSGTFTPALEGAEVLRLQLKGKLELHAKAHLDAPMEPSESFMALIKDTRALLAQVDELNPYLSLFDKRLAQLKNVEDLRTLWERARPEMTPADLYKIFQEMKLKDPNHELTREVHRMYVRRRDQETRFDEARDEFEELLLEELEHAIERYEAARNELPSPEADRELDQLQKAQGWLDTYWTALGDLETDPDQARRLHGSLDREALSWKFQEFRKVASVHLNTLLSECDKAAARQEGRRLCKQIKDLCDIRLLEDARRVLEVLKALDPEGLDLEIAAVRDRVDVLDEQERKLATSEKEFKTFRGLLQKGKLRSAEQLLVRLERAWDKEKALLDAALDIKEREELRLRRAILNMRLGAYSDALRDAERLHESREALLWRSLARFAQAHDDPSALADVERAISLPGKSARALYLRGVYRHLLLDTQQAQLFTLEDALQDLDEAVRTLGLDSGDACYHMAAIHLTLATIHHKANDSTQAVKFATAALNAPFTEDGIVVAFGGNRKAAHTDAVKQFHRNSYYVRAYAHLEGKNLEACIDDCNEAIDRDEKFADGYYVRGLAKYYNRQEDEAVRDIKKVIELTEPGTDPTPRDIVLRKDAQNALKEIGE